MFSFRETFFSFHKLAKIDPIIIFTVIAIFLFGLVMLYSAGGGNMSPWAMSQLKRFIVFIPVAVMIMIVDIKLIHRFAYLIYFSGLILLLLAEFAGYSAMGAKRWIKIGPLVLQPSEYMKICLVIMLARLFHNLHIYKTNNLFFLFMPIILTIVPFFLILKQPDLGTATILIASGIAIFFAAGVSIKKFIFAGGSVVLMIPFIWSNLKEYQKQRLLTYFNPEDDKLGAGYNIIQSKIAVGSGGLMGKGYLSGSQSQLSFLPERETDFIFTMLAEELGFFGSLLIIGLFTVLFLRSYLIASQTRNHFGRLLVVGLVSFLFLHFFINIAMVIGVIPVVGAPLPFFSYGGTILIISLSAISLIINVYIHKDVTIDTTSKR